jgi:pimeloyl-ACP methyl ester carboxylesterase
MNNIFKFIVGSIFSIISIDNYALSFRAHSTLLLVHGALFNSSGWLATQSYLQNAGYNVVTVDVPGRSNDRIDPKTVTLDMAANKVCKVAKLQSDKVILVGHSQGGAVITQAIDQCSDKIKALVYIAAVVPENQESVFQSLSQQDNDNFNLCGDVDEEKGVVKVNYQGPLQQMFMSDVSEQYARVAINNMTDEPLKIGDSVLHYSTSIFKNMPKFYIHTQYDRIISMPTQKMIVAKFQYNKIITLPTSHSPFISQPAILAKSLTKIVDSVDSH